MKPAAKLAGVLLVGVCLPLSASAQSNTSLLPPIPIGELTFDHVGGGPQTYDGPRTAPGETRRRVIRSSADLRSFFNDKIPPAVQNAGIKFNSETVIGVALGWFSNGGHTTDILRVHRIVALAGSGGSGGLFMPFPDWGDPPATLIIEYTERHPGPGDNAPKILTQPYVLIRLPYVLPDTDDVTWRKADVVSSTFTSISRRLNDGKNVKIVSVFSKGHVEITNIPLLTPGEPTTIQGTAKFKQHLEHLAQKISDAKFKEMPGEILAANPLGLTHFTYDVAFTEQDTKSVSGYIGREGKFKTKLDDVSEAISKVAANIDVDGPPPPPPPTTLFDKVIFETKDFVGIPGPSPFKVRTVVDRDGNVTITQDHLDAIYEPVWGEAKEFVPRLNAAVKKAKLSTPPKIPNPLDVVVPFHEGAEVNPLFLPLETFDLEVTGDFSGMRGKTSGQVGYLGQYRERLYDLIQVMIEIRDHVLGTPPPPPPLGYVDGIVDVRGPHHHRSVWLVRPNDAEIRVIPWAFAKTLIKFEDHEVRVAGQERESMPPALWVDKPYQDALLSPTRTDLYGELRDTGEGLRLMMDLPLPFDPPTWPVPLHDSEADSVAASADADASIAIWPGFPKTPVDLLVEKGSSGKRLYKLLEIAAKQGFTVSIDAYAWEEAPGRPTKALVNALWVTVLEDSNLTRGGTKVNEVKDGQRVKALRLSHLSDYRIKVDPENGGKPGFMSINKVRLGEQIFHIMGDGDATGALHGLEAAGSSGS